MESERLQIVDEIRAELVTARAVHARPIYARVPRISHVLRILRASLTVTGADPPPLVSRIDPAFLAHRVL
jgi:hypothetical protein